MQINTFLHDCYTCINGMIEVLENYMGYIFL